MDQFRATYNYLKHQAPSNLLQATYTYFEPIAIFWSILHLGLFRASHSYLKLLATVLEPLTVISSFFAPISSHLHLFEASLTYFEPLGIIWISWSFQYGFRAMCTYFELLAPFFECTAAIWNSLHLFRASCRYLKLLAPISSYLQLF